MQSRMGRRLTLTLGGLLLAFGVVEVIAHRDDTAVALLFWGGSLLGGGGLVVAGALVWPRSRGMGLTFVVIGTLAGLLATAWTILIPLLGIAVLVLAVRDASRSPEATPAS
jgi:hypothetical protein